jgi:hypothetical protein
MPIARHSRRAQLVDKSPYRRTKPLHSLAGKSAHDAAPNRSARFPILQVKKAESLGVPD